MALQDMPHCNEHCMDSFPNWTCGYKKWYRWHKKSHYVGCYFMTPYIHEIGIEDMEKLPE